VTRWRTLWGRWRALTPGERRLVVLAMTWLPIVHRRLRQDGLAPTKTWLGRRAWRFDVLPDLAKAMTYAIDVAARHGLVAGTCLSRSLLLDAWLRGAGLEPVLRIGVRKDLGVTYAHAWVEVGGLVVNDQPDINRRYAVLVGERDGGGPGPTLGDARIE
jgi:hypothetical protein